MIPASIRKFVLPAILVLGLLLRVYWFAYDPSLWTAEENISASVIKNNVGQLATQPLEDQEMAPVGFLAAEKLLGSLGGYREWSLRLFPLLCGMAALLVFARLARELFTGAPLLVAVGLFSFCGPLIYHAGEMKQYATENLGAVVILWLAVRLRRGVTLPQALAAGVVGAVCVWFSFSSAWVIAGVFSTLGIYFLRQKKFRQVGCVAVMSILPLVSFLAYYLVLLRPQSSLAAQQALNAEYFAPWPVSPSAWLWYVRTVYLALGDPFGVSLDVDLPFLPHSAAFKFLVTLSYPAILLGLVGVWRFWKHDGYLGCLLGSPLVFAWAASLLHEYPLRERHLVFFIPTVCLLLAKAIDPLAATAAPQTERSRLALKALLAWASVYVLINLGAKVADPPLFAGRKFSTMREAIQFISANRQKGDTVYVMYNAPLFYFYYNYLEHLDWPVITGDDPSAGAHSFDDVRAGMKRAVDANAAAHPRTWYLLVGVFQPVTYTDEKGVVHDTQIPTADVYAEVLQADEKVKIAAKYTGHGAAAYLVEGGAR